MINLTEMLLAVVLPYLTNSLIAAGTFVALMWLRWRSGKQMLLPASAAANGRRK